MTFTEANTVERMILERVDPRQGSEPMMLREELSPGNGAFHGNELLPARWDYLLASDDH